jgi:hypothetical protein
MGEFPHPMLLNLAQKYPEEKRAEIEQLKSKNPHAWEQIKVAII